MKDLEIRAEEYVIKNPDNGMHLLAHDIDETHRDYTFLDVKGAYMKGAIDQEKIDTDKACECLRRIIDTRNRQWEGVWVIQSKDVLEQFRKELEERSLL